MHSSLAPCSVLLAGIIQCKNHNPTTIGRKEKKRLIPKNKQYQKDKTASINAPVSLDCHHYSSTTQTRPHLHPVTALVEQPRKPGQRKKKETNMSWLFGGKKEPVAPPAPPPPPPETLAQQVKRNQRYVFL